MVLLAVGISALCAIAVGQNKKDAGGLAKDAELVETKTSVPTLKAAGAYEPKDNIVEIELSEYAGYSGLIVANGGMAPNEDSAFFKKHGFKVKLSLSEDESWSPLNSGRMAASATTADVLTVYGKQFQVVVPALISYSRGADGVVTRTDVKKINDLKGKVVSTCQFTESDFLIRYLAQEAQLPINMLADLSARPDPDKINLVFCQDGFGAGDIFLRDLKDGRSRLAGCVTWDPKTTEVAEGSNGKAAILLTNRNLLIVADILIVNKGFAEKHPDMVRGLVDGLMEGNNKVRTNPQACLDVIAKAFKWDKDKAQKELAKVHLANLPENLAFFSGTIDSAGSFGYIYESTVMAYGDAFIPNPAAAEKFLDTRHLEALDKEGTYKDQKVSVQPIKLAGGVPIEKAPVLSRNVRFLFEPNLAKLDLADKGNVADLEHIAKIMQVSPGSTILLRGHADPSFLEEIRKQGGEELVRKMSFKAMELSKERCDAVKKIMVEQYKIDEGRVETLGRGYSEPLGKDPAQNRRVEVQWFTLE